MVIGDSRRNRIISRIIWVNVRNARLCCLIAGLLLSLVSASRAEQLPFKNYTTADGLARDQINRIVRDSHGFLWFCTREGLSRFDGYTVTNYANAQGLPGRAVSDLLETRDGIYWVATDVGVYRFNPAGLAAAQSNAQIKAEPSQSTKPGESSAEAMFVAYYLSGEQKPYDATALLEDHAGVIWCGTNVGVYQLDRSGDRRAFRFVDMGMPMNYEEPLVETLLEDRHGALWAGTRGSGLYRHLRDGHTEHYTAQHGLPNIDVRALLEDREGHLGSARERVCVCWFPTRSQISQSSRALSRKRMDWQQTKCARYSSLRMGVCGSACSAG
jgi:ligand-binding sensor domain-containing protein